MKATGTGGKNSLSNWTLLQIMLKTRFSFLYASTGLVTKTLTIASNRNFESYVNSLSCSSAHLPVFPFLPRVFPLPLATLLIIVSSSSTLHWANEITMKKRVSAMGYFSREILIHRHWRQEVPLSYWFFVFRRRDNLLVWVFCEPPWAKISY